MTLEKLHKAKSLREKIEQLESILNSFYQDESQEYSRKPSLIVECDGDDSDRLYISFPFTLNSEFINLIKEEVQNQLIVTREEFNKL